jgi:hypothetical protein
MSRRKGELSSVMVDIRWPHQVALPERETLGWRYRFVHEFCRELSLCPRGHTVVYGGEYWNVFCFKEEADAELFRKRFGGEKFDPAQRGKGKNWAQWNRK